MALLDCLVELVMNCSFNSVAKVGWLCDIPTDKITNGKLPLKTKFIN